MKEISGINFQIDNRISYIRNNQNLNECYNFKKTILVYLVSGLLRRVTNNLSISKPKRL